MKIKQNKQKAGVLKDKSNVNMSFGGADDNLEIIYDADELDDQFATKADIEIAKVDIPERL